MNLSINGQTGKVGVGEFQTFTVAVHADSILPNGYIGAQVWVDFGDTGLVPKANQQALWPDCDPSAFVTGSSGNAENAGCLTGVINFPVSDYKGPIFSFDATCDNFGNSHTIQLLSEGHPEAAGSGAAYVEPSSAIIRADHAGDFVADEIVVNCEHAFPPVTINGTLYESQGGLMRGATLTLEPLGIETTSSINDGTFHFFSLSPGSYTIVVKSPACTPFGCYKPTPIYLSGVQSKVTISIYPNLKLPEPRDTDGDGCSDQRENELDETIGGLRDYQNPWDFYDVAGTNGGSPDGVIDLFNDVLGVINRFAPTGTEAEYDAQYDRGPTTGPYAWNMTAPDGSINLFDDILGVIAQFGHDCR